MRCAYKYGIVQINIWIQISKWHAEKIQILFDYYGAFLILCLFAMILQSCVVVHVSDTVCSYVCVWVCVCLWLLTCYYSHTHTLSQQITRSAQMRRHAIGAVWMKIRQVPTGLHRTLSATCRTQLLTPVQAKVEHNTMWWLWMFLTVA